MKKLILVFSITLIFMILLTACSTSSDSKEYSFTEKKVMVKSERNTDIPAILTIPEGKSGKKFPVVIMAHGHGGSKDESGGFTVLAQDMAKYGIASIRLDFPGCGESTENFTEANNLTNQLSDIESCKKYLSTLDNVNMKKLGVFGYSMGGRAAMVTAGRDKDYKATAFWSPAGSKGGSDLYLFMQCNDENGFNSLYETAKKDGKVTYHCIYGFDQELSVKWFDDMININPLDEYAKFKGSSLVVYGEKDVIVTPTAAKAIAASAVKAKDSETYEVKGADHGYGIYSNEPDITQDAVDAVVKFFNIKL